MAGLISLPSRNKPLMPDFADLYPGFATRWIDGAAGRTLARAGGEGRDQDGMPIMHSLQRCTCDRMVADFPASPSPFSVPTI